MQTETKSAGSGCACIFLVVHVCIACRLAGNSQVSIAESIQHARIIVMRVRIFPGQENQVCLSASGTGRIGRYLFVFRESSVTLA
jgi:hypothetical protein